MTVRSGSISFSVRATRWAAAFGALALLSACSGGQAAEAEHSAAAQRVARTEKEIDPLRTVMAGVLPRRA